MSAWSEIPTDDRAMVIAEVECIARQQTQGAETERARGRDVDAAVMESNAAAYAAAAVFLRETR